MRACSRRGTSCGLHATTAATTAAGNQQSRGRPRPAPARRSRSAVDGQCVRVRRRARCGRRFRATRAAPRASSRLATLPHAINSTSPTAASSVSSRFRTSPTNCSTNGTVPKLTVSSSFGKSWRRRVATASSFACACCRVMPGLQAAVDGEVVLVVHRALRGRECDWRPQFLAVGGQVERLRHHAGDPVRRAVHAELAADRRLAGAEAPRPQAMAEHDDVVVAGAVLVGGERPSQDRPDAHHVEVVGGDARADDPLRRRLVGEVVVGVVERGEPVLEVATRRRSCRRSCRPT